MDILTITILVIIAIVIIWVVASFNGLVTLKNRAKEAWSDIDVQLKRRILADTQNVPAYEPSFRCLHYCKHSAPSFIGPQS